MWGNVVVSEVAIKSARDGGMLAFLFEACKKEVVAAGGVHPPGEKNKSTSPFCVL